MGVTFGSDDRPEVPRTPTRKPVRDGAGRVVLIMKHYFEACQYSEDILRRPARPNSCPARARPTGYIVLMIKPMCVK